MGWESLITSFLQVTVIPLAAMWITGRLKKPKDFERAEEYKTIARSAAALVMINNPGKNWSELLSLVINELSNQIPTQGARQRAAAEALKYWEQQGGPATSK